MTSVTTSQLDTSITETNLPEAQFDNFFALFEQPVQFELIQNQLDQRLRQLQKHYHPDNVAKNSIEANVAKSLQQAEQASAIINQAYQTLSRADSRAGYLLDMAGQAQTLENSIADLDFLEDAMDLRIDLDEAIDSKDKSTLQQLHPQIADRLSTQAMYFNQAYTSQDWQTAIDATQKLKFLVKLDADITIALDNLADSHQTDDDLYV
ncbi:Fe-S protein assembly co-chaperone HscB [Psychrobacter urativorans]|uniref:Fe-S protein assembly co-chaperone HscB n=1 Tax=Psychrobacter urativorans TaxID=45610 RepID=UPI00191B3551|nr:Fe-S protein assembly co-chaperone HscB [Psychrobacter urativorans]